MTYCVGMKLGSGLVLMADTMTNAGVDNISRYRKIFDWSIEGERQLYLLTSGNLATSQAVISTLKERSKEVDQRQPAILETSSMFQTAKLISQTLRETILNQSESGQLAESTFNATLILAGQIKGGQTGLYLIYPEGNFIEMSEDSPFFQIGETKYGKPILVRAYHPDLSFEQAIKLLMVSFDSTIKANLSVGMPLDLVVYENDSLNAGYSTRIEANDEYFRSISEGWGFALQEAFHKLPDYQIK